MISGSVTDVSKGAEVLRELLFQGSNGVTGVLLAVADTLAAEETSPRVN